MGHEKVPCGFRLRTGDPGDTADGAGNHGRPASRAQIIGKRQGYLSHGLLFLFLRYSTPDQAKMGEGRTVCVCGCFKGLWNFNEDIKSLLLTLYNF